VLIFQLLFCLAAGYAIDFGTGFFLCVMVTAAIAVHTANADNL
jgi:hypothetical protein